MLIQATRVIRINSRSDWWLCRMLWNVQLQNIDSEQSSLSSGFSYVKYHNSLL